MASPQKENGYTPIANELVEALAHIRVNGEAMQVLWVILRKTYGFQKKSDSIALSQFSLATGLSKIAVRKAVNKLLSLNIITQKGNDLAKEYCLVKDYSSWKPLPKKVTLPKKVRGVTQKGTKRYPKSAQQKKKETITKETIVASKDAPLIVGVIDAFEIVNSAYKKWYARPPQRDACIRLIEAHGYDQVLRVIKLLPISNEKPYFPSITTPIQLEDKWAQLESAWKRFKNEKEINKVKII
jgi:phage replication O-like protein O